MAIQDFKINKFTFLVFVLFSCGFFFQSYLKLSASSNALTLAITCLLILIIFLRSVTQTVNFKILITTFFFFATIFVALIVSILNGTDFLTFLKSSKYVVPLVILPFIISKIGSQREISPRLDFSGPIVFNFLLFYLIAVFSNPDKRPEIFVENNFEMFGLNLFVLFTIIREKKVNFYFILGYLVVIFLSRSLSAYIFSILNIGYLFYLRSDRFTYSKVLSFPILSILAIFVFNFLLMLRGFYFSDLEAVDRVVFIYVGIQEFHESTLIQNLFGNLLSGSQLSLSTCDRLSWYVSQIGVCEGAIFHNGMLRVLFDFGIIGLVIFNVVLWNISSVFRNTKFWSQFFVYLGIVASSMSVSVTSTEFFLMPFLFQAIRFWKG